MEAVEKNRHLGIFIFASFVLSHAEKKYYFPPHSENMLGKTGGNIGSICKMRIVDTKDVLTMPFAYKASVLTPPILKDGKVWETLKFTRDTCHFVEGSERPYFPLSVKFRSPKDSAGSLADLHKLESTRWIVEFTDLNGAVKYAGTIEEGCAIFAELRDNGQNKRDSNHYNCVITLKRMERAPILVT